MNSYEASFRSLKDFGLEDVLSAGQDKDADKIFNAGILASLCEDLPVPDARLPVATSLPQSRLASDRERLLYRVRQRL
jgi:hypothetical protein